MEKIIDIISQAQKTKWLGLVQTPYCIIITDQSTIFAKIDTQKLNDYLKEVREESHAKGAGFFEKVKAQMYASANYAERYRSLSPQDIRAESPENQSIPHNQIQKIKVRYFDTIETEDTSDNRNQTTLTYKTSTEKIKFTIQGNWKKKIKQMYEGKCSVV